MGYEQEWPRRSAQCRECGISLRKSGQASTFLRMNKHSLQRIDLCESCASKRKKELKGSGVLWQWSRREEKEKQDTFLFHELVGLLFSSDSTLNEQEKFVLAHVLKRGKMIRQCSQNKEFLVVETLDKSQRLTLAVPQNVCLGESFETVHNLFQVKEV
jgi:hypothetical protein